MTDAEYVKRRIELIRPRAKFVRYSHSDEFIDSSANLGAGFHHVNLYDEKIDANVIKTPRGLILLQNTYLPSFAYNLLLCWLYSYDPAKPDHLPLLKPLLKYNFKKFFAEQLLHQHNNIFSRAIFLETLLYEQAGMVPVFDAKTQDGTLDRLARFGSQIMSSLVSFHELGHYFLERDVAIWNEVVRENHHAISSLASRVTEQYPASFVTEFRCDVLSVISCLKQYDAETERALCLRTISFGFTVFAVLSSLTKSAQQTIVDQKAVVESVDFNGIEKQHRNYTYTIGLDTDFIERAQLVIELCEQTARQDGISLFETDSGFPLPHTLLDDLLAYTEVLMDNEDSNSRAMSLLVAEALHEHPHGVDFLYLRSKTFSTGH